ncbi:hypothetical protein LCGC14_1477610 [marine sediment metagenome]|uniref:Uncharacterized protein n=1 Tax=marine sediment metagenome TaxID=412755 RepID=A0A0F9JWJ9_9ZZZZ
MAGIRKWVRVGSPSGVAINSTATAHLAMGRTYHALLMKFTSTLANMSEIRVVTNGVAIWRLSAEELDELNQHYGRAASGTNGELVLDFDRRGVRARSGAELSAIGCAPWNAETNNNAITSLTLEVDFGAGATPALTVAAYVSQAESAGVMRKIRPFTHTPPGAATFEIDSFPRQEIILAAHLKSALLTRVRVEVDQKIAHDLTIEENDRIINDGYDGLVAIADYYHFNPAYDGHASEWLETAGSTNLLFAATVSGATTINSLVEYLGRLSL